jgi:hypothetical protein
LFEDSMPGFQASAKPVNVFANVPSIRKAAAAGYKKTGLLPVCFFRGSGELLIPG